MMLRKSFSILVMAATLAAMAVSCSHETELPDSEGTGIDKIFAVVDSPVATKTVLEEDGSTYKVCWRRGDAIRVFTPADKTGAKFVFSEVDSSDPTKATFLLASGETAPTGNTFWAVYPYDADYTFDGKTLNAEIPQTQHYAVMLNGGNVATASEQTGTTLSFKNVGGIVRIRLTSPTGIAISAASITDVSSEKTFNLVFDSPCTLSSDATDVFFNVPSGLFGGGMSLTLTDSNGQTMTKTSSAGKVERSTVLCMPEIECTPAAFSYGDWSFTLSKMSNSPQSSATFTNVTPVFSPDGQTAYFQSQMKNIIAVNIPDGTIKWQTNSLGEITHSTNSFVTQPVVNPVTGEIYVNCNLSTDETNMFVALDPATGSITKKKSGILNKEGPGPAISEDGSVVFVGTTGYTVYALSASDFTVLGSFKMDTGFRHMVLVKDKLVCLGNDDELRIATYDDTKEIGSRLSAGDNLGTGIYAETTGCPAVSPDGRYVYFQGSDADLYGGKTPTAGYLLKLDLNDNSTEKVKITNAKFVYSTVVDSEGYVYITTAGNSSSAAATVRKMTPDLSMTVWSYSAMNSDPNGFNRSTPCIDSNGYLYILSRVNSGVYRIRTADGSGSLFMTPPTGATATGAQYGITIANGYLVTAFSGTSTGVIAGINIGANLAGGWSTAGGDICFSKRFIGGSSEKAGVKGGTVASVTVKSSGTLLYTYDYVYDGTGSLAGVKMTSNSFDSSDRTLLNASAGTGSYNVSFSTGTQYLTQYTLTSSALTYKGSWDGAVQIPLALSNGKPSSSKTTVAYSSAYYSSSSTTQNNYYWSGGNLSSIVSKATTQTSFQYLTKTIREGIMTTKYEYSNYEDQCNFGVLFMDSALSDFAVWFCQGYPGCEMLPSSRSIYDSEGRLLYETYTYTLDSEGRIGSIKKLVNANDALIGDIDYTISYK